MINRGLFMGKNRILHLKIESSKKKEREEELGSHRTKRGLVGMKGEGEFTILNRVCHAIK